MKNIVHLSFKKDVVSNVVLEELELLVAEQMRDVRRVAGDEIIETDNAMPFGQQSVAEMGAEETGAAGDNGCGFKRSQ